MYLLFGKLDDSFENIKQRFKEFVIFSGNKIINEKRASIDQNGKDDIKVYKFYSGLLIYREYFKILRNHVKSDF